jgi:hypothetical protein
MGQRRQPLIAQAMGSVDCPERQASSGYTSYIDLANIVDAKAQHREAFEPIPSANREVACWIAAKMPNNPVCVDAPGENLRPPTVIIYFKLPSLCAHWISRRDDFHRR